MATPNDWELIFGDQPDQQARMLSNMLRRRQAFADIVGLTGEPQLQPWAQSAGRSADEGLDRLAKVGIARKGIETDWHRQQMENAYRMAQEKNQTALAIQAMKNAVAGPTEKPPTPADRKAAASLNMIPSAFASALRIGVPESGLSPKSLSQSFGQMASRAGFPQFASAAAEQTDAAWTKVVQPVILLLSGQQMAMQEFNRRYAALAPRPGEADETQLSKIRDIPQLIRDFVPFVHPEFQEAMRRQADMMDLMRPKTVRDLKRFKATGGGGLQPQQYPGTPEATGAAAAPSVDDLVAGYLNMQKSHGKP